MSAGARRAEPEQLSALQRYGGIAAVVAILAVVGSLMVFGDDLVGGGDAEADNPMAQSAQAAGEAASSPAAEDEVVSAATAVLTTWSRPELGYRAWWKGFRPLLTPGGQEAYAFTDPDQIPLLVDITASRVVLNPSGATATVWFQTGTGEFGVDMSRKRAKGDWLANRIVFPGQESMFS